MKSESNVIALQNECKTRSIASYYKLKKSINLPLKIKMFYAMLENCLEKTNQLYETTCQVSKDFGRKYKLLISTFKHQTEDEKIRLLYDTLKIVKGMVRTHRGSLELCSTLTINPINKQEQEVEDYASSDSDGLNEIKEIETTSRIK